MMGGIIGNRYKGPYSIAGEYKVLEHSNEHVFNVKKANLTAIHSRGILRTNEYGVSGYYMRCVLDCHELC